MGKEKEKSQESEAPVKISDHQKHHTKVSKLSLSELDAALENAQKHMGGLYSKHALFLLEQRNVLLASQAKPAPMKKAA